MKNQLIPIIAAASLIALPSVVSGATGEEVWMKYCKKCHGDDGKGQTAMGKRFEIRDYTDPAIQAEWSDEDIKAAVIDGVKNESGKKVMLAFGKKLSEEEVDAVVAYLRSLAVE
ncbi:MAG: cytochrome c [Puniceicoccaceae bacterium]